MKKIILTFLLSLSLILGGCFGSDYSRIKDIDITVSGEISSIEISRDIPGTHILTVGDDVFYLRSKEYDLSEFIGEEIQVKGLLSIEKGEKVIQVLEIEKEESSGNEEENEETTIEKILGFDIEIPETWNITENDLKTLGNFRFNRTTLAELSKLGTKTTTPEKWLEERSYEDFEKVFDKDNFSFYQASPLNYFVFNTENEIYQLTLITTDKKRQEIIINSFKTDEIAVVEEEKLFPEPDSIEEINNEAESSFTSEVNQKTPTQSSSDTINKFKSEGQKIADSKPQIESPYNITEIRITDDENYGYIIIDDSTNKDKRILIKNSNSNYQEIGFFEEGIFRDWNVISGSDESFGKSVNVYKIQDGVTEKKVTISPDMRLYENTRYGFSIQYPKNWYFAGLGAQKGSIYTVSFSESLNEIDDTVSIYTRIYSPENAPTVSSDGNISYKLIETDKYTFILSTTFEEGEAYFEQMADSIVVN